jgi:hypothetical protein
MFRRLPQSQQIEVLRQADADELKRYWPHAEAFTFSPTCE